MLVDMPYNDVAGSRPRDAVEHFEVAVENVHQCCTCSAKFPHNNALEEHSKISRHGVFLCSCNRSYTRLCSLKRHIRCVTDPTVFECHLCDGNSFSRPDKLDDHLTSRHRVSRRRLTEIRSQRQQSSGSTAPPSIYSMSSMASMSSFWSQESASTSFQSSAPRSQLPDAQSRMQESVWSPFEDPADPDDCSVSPDASPWSHSPNYKL